MNAVNIGKTILIWNELNNSEITQIIEGLEKIIEKYRNITNGHGYKRPIPIPLYKDNNYLSIVFKHNEIFLSTTRKDSKWYFNPIINCDELYKSIEFIEEYDINKYFSICEKYPDTKWIELPYNKAFELYALSPNINPKNFIENLEKGHLSEFYKNFLKEVGFSLENTKVPKEMRQNIQEINDFLEER